MKHQIHTNVLGAHETEGYKRKTYPLRDKHAFGISTVLFSYSSRWRNLPAFQVSLRQARDGKDNWMKQFFIPMEVTKETLRDFDLSAYEICWWPVGDKRKLVAMIPATEEEYQEYMRPLWREKKNEDRHFSSEFSVEELRNEHGWDVEDESAGVEEAAIKKELLEALHAALEGLEEIDKTIAAMYAEGRTEAEIGKAVGMTQRGVGMRKQRLFSELNEKLKSFL